MKNFSVRITKTSCHRPRHAEQTVQDAPPSRHTVHIEAVNRGKQRIGCIRIDDGETITPFWVEVSPGWRRSGVGTALYERAAKEACRRFKRPLSSDTDLSPEARKFWEKQYRKGRAECDFSEGRKCTSFSLRCPAPVSLAAARRR